MLEVSGGDARVVFHRSLTFDVDLPHYGTRSGVLPNPDPRVAVSSPVMWAEALDRFMASLAGERGLDLSRLRAVSGAAQQHGSVYLNHEAGDGLARLDSKLPLEGQVPAILSRDVSPIWMDSSPSAECAHLASALGGDDAVQRLTGSRPTERFTGPQIRRFSTMEPAAYAATGRIHLVSSFLASLLVGEHAPIDHGDGSGMNLMDLRRREWAGAALDATAPNLREKLPALVTPWSAIGRVAGYWRERYGLPGARVVAWTGDNPSSLIGLGIVDAARLAVSLGTSDTIFGIVSDPDGVPPPTCNVFASPTGDDMALICFKNGALARERVRDAYGLDWDAFARILGGTEPGNAGRIMLPWFEPEITPPVLEPGVHRFGFDDSDAGANVRAVVEAQMAALALHSSWMGAGPRAVYATGGAARSEPILQVMADVFGAEVHRAETTDSVALGAALRAWHGDRYADGEPIPWGEVVHAIAAPAAAGVIRPNPRNIRAYAAFRGAYAACEAFALGTGPDPAPWLDRLHHP